MKSYVESHLLIELLQKRLAGEPLERLGGGPAVQLTVELCMVLVMPHEGIMVLQSDLERMFGEQGRYMLTVGHLAARDQEHLAVSIGEFFEDVDAADAEEVVFLVTGHHLALHDYNDVAAVVYEHCSPVSRVLFGGFDDPGSQPALAVTMAVFSKRPSSGTEAIRSLLENGRGRVEGSPWRVR